MICSNCNTEFFPAVGGLSIRVQNTTPTKICPSCLTGALVLQVTVRRENTETPFTHQCYQVLEATDEAADLPGEK